MMLILTRTPAEQVHIGDDITVTVLSVRGNQVRLGFKAPKDITVHRSEIAEKIIAELQAQQLTQLLSKTHSNLSNPSTLKAACDNRTHLGKGEAVLSSKPLHRTHYTRRQRKHAHRPSQTILLTTGEAK